MLVHCDNYFNQDIKPDDIKESRKKKRVEDNTGTYVNAPQKCQRRNNSSNNEHQPKNVTWDPLLVGKVIFRRPNKRHVPLHRKELSERKLLKMEETEKNAVTKLVQALREAEHPILSKKNKSDLTDEDKEELKFFKLVAFTAEEWDEDNISETLVKHFKMQT